MAGDAHLVGAPLEAAAAGCAVMLPSATTSATRCGGEPTTAAELSYSYDGSVWLVFFCRDHGEALNIRWDIES